MAVEALADAAVGTDVDVDGLRSPDLELEVFQVLLVLALGIASFAGSILR
jgi:hypothetical protein